MISGGKKLNETDAYLELSQMIRQEFQKAMKQRTDPRLIKCLYETKFPSGDVKNVNQ